MIEVTLNGRSTQVTSMPVRALLERKGIDPERPGIAVALNDRLLRRGAWEETMLSDQDRVEVITALQGG